MVLFETRGLPVAAIFRTYTIALKRIPASLTWQPDQAAALEYRHPAPVPNDAQTFAHCNRLQAINWTRSRAPTFSAFRYIPSKVGTRHEQPCAYL
jgi:hypothetical protein